MPIQHEIQLSNGEKVILEEGNDCLHVGARDPRDASDQWWICRIEANGILVMPNSGYAGEDLVKGLKRKET